MAITSNIDVINAALTRVGAETITEITEAGAGPAIANANYDQAVARALSVHRWKWASKVEVLNLIDADEEGDPPEPWTETWQLPGDLLLLRTIKVSGVPIKYERMRDKVFAAQGDDAELVAFYVWLAPESEWPAYFTEYVIEMLEAAFLRGIGERYDEAATREEVARKVTLPEAKRLDTQSQPGIDPYVSGTLRARSA